MNNERLSTTIEEGSTGQFELFESQQGEWISFMKESTGCVRIPKFFTIEDVQKKLG